MDEWLEPVRAGAVTAARTVIEAARAGDAASALVAMSSFRVLCAHRRGDHGVATCAPACSARWRARRPRLEPPL